MESRRGVAYRAVGSYLPYAEAITSERTLDQGYRSSNILLSSRQDDFLAFMSL